MKKMNFSFSAMVSRLCVVVLAFLGYGCKDNGDDNILLMYGTPTGLWEIKGEVTDEVGEPVSDATVKVTYPDANSTDFTVGEAKTNETGNYSADGHEFAGKLKVVCVPDNPQLEADSTVVTLKYSGGDGWYRGSAEATANFKLKKK